MAFFEACNAGFPLIVVICYHCKKAIVSIMFRGFAVVRHTVAEQLTSLLTKAYI